MTREDLPTGTVTFLFSDIEGSTRLVGELDPLVYREVLEQHNALMRSAMAANGGVERGTQGDAFLVVFRDASAAVAAGVAAQRGLARAVWPHGRSVDVRMGLHTGHGIAGGDDYVGLDINRAARIASAAHGGQMLVSDSTRALVERSLPAGVGLLDLGEHRLKDLARPERLFQVTADGLRPSFPPLRTLGGPAGDLPVRLTTFVGREREILEVERLVEGQRLVTLTGPGGTGKSSLAVEVARAAAVRFHDGAWFVALDSVVDPELVASVIAKTLGLIEGGGPARDRLLTFAADRSLLLVLDNLEQVRSAAPFLAELLRSAPGVRILATSRAPLRVSGEQEYPVPPLAVPDSPATARAADCVVLFTERARRVRPSFEPSDDDVAAISEICARLDGLPLGIELAAGRTGILPPATIADRLGRHLELPGSGPSDVPERQRTMAAAISWSHDLLDPPSRRLFARLAVFVGGARLEEIEVVCGGDLGTDVLEGLSGLVEQSLVITSIGPDGPRFGLLETIRAFAAERLAEASDRDATVERHARVYLALLEASVPFLPGRDQKRWLARLSAEQENLRAATHRAIDHGDVDASLRFVAASWRYWQLAGHLEEAMPLAAATLALPGVEDAPLALRVAAADAVGGLHYWRGEPILAGERYAEQLTLARRLGEPKAIADALYNLSFSTGIRQDFSRAREMTDEAARLYRQVGDERSLARMDWASASLRQFEGDNAGSLALLEGALSRFEATGDLPYAALTLGSIGWARLNTGDLAGGLESGLRSLIAYHALGDIATTTLTLHAAAIAFGLVGLPADGAVMEGAFAALSGRYGVRPPLALESVIYSSDVVAKVIETMTGPAFATERARGATMSLDEAVDFAGGVAAEQLATG